MFIRFVKSSSFLLLLLGLGGCLSDLELVPEKENQEVLACLIDGKPFEATSGKGLLAVDFIRTELLEDENSFLLTVFGVRMQDNGEALAVGFKLGGKNLQDIQPGDTFTEWLPMENVEGAFEGAQGGVEKRKSATSSENIYQAGSHHTGNISLTITAIDLKAKRISGTYHFTARDIEKDIQLEVTQGSFENIQWE